MSESECPSADVLSAFVEGNLPEAELETLSGHILDCGSCRGVVVALKRADAAAALPRIRRWMPLAAAAALLLAASGSWLALQARGRSGPEAGAPGPLAADRRPRVLAVGGECRAPAAVWLGPGRRLQVRSGAISRVADSRLALSEGEVRIEQCVSGPLEIVTPDGLVQAQGPWVARVCRRQEAAGTLAGLWMGSAEAASPPELLIEVHEGQATLALGNGRSPTLVQAGERLRLTPGGAPRLERFSVPAPEGLSVWQGPELAALLGTASLRLEGGTGGQAWPLPLPQGRAYQVELQLRSLSPVSRLALAAPVGGVLRLWQLSGTDCPGEKAHTVGLAVLGGSASGSVDGRRLWTVQEALSALQPANAPAGLRVWGEVEVLELRIRTWEQKGENHGP